MSATWTVCVTTCYMAFFAPWLCHGSCSISCGCEAVPLPIMATSPAHLMQAMSFLMSVILVLVIIMGTQSTRFSFRLVLATGVGHLCRWLHKSAFPRETTCSMGAGTAWPLLPIILPAVPQHPAKANRPLVRAPALRVWAESFSDSLSLHQKTHHRETQWPVQSHTMNLWQSLLTHLRLTELSGEPQCIADSYLAYREVSLSMFCTYTTFESHLLLVYYTW